MWAACARSSLVASKIAHEKSRRSLMFAEKATRWSTIPISSAAASKRLRMTSSSIGSMTVIALQYHDAVLPRGGHPAGGHVRRRLRVNQKQRAGSAPADQFRAGDRGA